jgi:spore coat polysaccharide biosynthesis protein SpsF
LADTLKNKAIIIWTEGGKEIGLGHLSRCMTIAQQIKKKCSDVLFFINDDPSIVNRVSKEGFDYEIASLNKIDLPVTITGNTDVVLIDTKKPIVELVKHLKASGHRVILVDNVTHARLKADIALYPTAIFEKSLNWDDFKGKVFYGADYVLISESFILERQKAKDLKFQSPYQVLVTMGGADPNHLTYKVVSSLLEFKELINLKVVVGPAFLHDDRLDKIEKRKYSNIEFIRNVKDMSSLMAESHIAITAVGITIFELAYMGIPSIIIANYETDDVDMDLLKKLGCVLLLDYYENVSDVDIRKSLELLVTNKKLWEAMSKKGKTLIDGHGAERIAAIIDKIN